MFGELMRWNPNDELASWHRDIDDLFSRFFGGRREVTFGGWMPALETYQKDGQYVVRVDLPGVDPKNVDVHTEGNVLTITGERKSEEHGSQYREVSYGKFERRLTLPQGIDSEKIAAQYEKGVLEIRVPLPAQLTGKKIPIQLEEGNKKKIESKAA